MTMDIGDNLLQVILALFSGAGCVFYFMRKTIINLQDKVNSLEKTSVALIQIIFDLSSIVEKNQKSFPVGDLTSIAQAKANLEIILNKLKT